MSAALRMRLLSLFTQFRCNCTLTFSAPRARPPQPLPTAESPQGQPPRGRAGPVPSPLSGPATAAPRAQTLPARSRGAQRSPLSRMSSPRRLAAGGPRCKAAGDWRRGGGVRALPGFVHTRRAARPFNNGRGGQRRVMAGERWARRAALTCPGPGPAAA